MEDLEDFAFFVVNFHYTRSQYDTLTPAEKRAIMKAYETRTVTETTLIRDAVFNALINAHRKKGKPFRKLWRKTGGFITKREAKDKVTIIKEIEEKEKGWIQALYKNVGIRPKKRRKKRERGKGLNE